jgi:flagellar biosynthesis repressor protein FlbT
LPCETRSIFINTESGKRPAMALMIEIKSGDKLIINGAVIENSGPNTQLLIHNKSAILREKEVMSEDEVKTPASRIYFSLQCAYIFPNKVNDHVEQFEQFARQYLEASPSSAHLMEEIVVAVQEENFYKSLKLSQKLLKQEKKLINGALEGLDDEPDMESMALLETPSAEIDQDNEDESDTSKK